jgi:BMFP domain-containing protein YqiC
MQRRRSVSYKFEKNISAQKAKLEALLVELNAQLAFLNKARPKMALLRKRIRQLDAEVRHLSGLTSHKADPPSPSRIYAA